MKPIDLIRHLEEHGVKLLREGSNHSVYVNRTTGKTSTLPRHREINEFLPKKSVKILKPPPHNSSQDYSTSPTLMVFIKCRALLSIPWQVVNEAIGSYDRTRDFLRNHQQRILDVMDALIAKTSQPSTSLFFLTPPY